MTDVALLKSSIKLCMFDQYGTVVDMQGGLRDFSAGFLAAKGWGGDPNAFVTWWRRTHFENSMIDALLQREHTPYREIGHLSVRQVMDRAGIAHTGDDVRTLVAAIERLECFPEVPAALGRLHARYKLVVLSNGDPDMLEAAKQYHRIPFDAVISVAEANALAAPSDLRDGGTQDGSGDGRGSVRRQPRVRLCRRQSRGHAQRLHRPPPPPVRTMAVPAGPDCVQHDGTRRPDGVILIDEAAVALDASGRSVG
jgi:2-haloalkanoic acid dehalogenase type II